MSMEVTNFGRSQNRYHKGKYYTGPGFWRTTGAIIAGGVASSAVGAVSYPFGKYAINQMIEINKEAKDSFQNAILPAAERMLEESGLKKAGVKIIDAGSKEFYEKYVKSLEDWLNIFKVPKKLQELNPIIAAHRGKNAFFLPLTNTVNFSKDKLALTSFHELGHALNYNFSKIGKALQYTRMPGMALAGLFATVALFKRKKGEGEKTNGFFDKTTTFIKNNVGKLAFAAMLPMIIEEGMASYKGGKWAQKLLSSDLAKKVNKTNAWGFATYVAAAAVAGLSAWAASAVRDKIAPPRRYFKKEIVMKTSPYLNFHQG